MKKLKIMVSMLCMCITLATPMTAFAAQTESINVNSVTLYANIWNGIIVANNVNIRSSNGISLGQVNSGDTLTIDLELDWKYFNGIMYRQVTMTSGQNKGLTGWVAADYINVTF